MISTAWKKVARKEERVATAAKAGGMLAGAAGLARAKARARIRRERAKAKERENKKERAREIANPFTAMPAGYVGNLGTGEMSVLAVLDKWRKLEVMAEDRDLSRVQPRVWEQQAQRQAHRG